MSLNNDTDSPGEKHANNVPTYESGTLAQHARGRQFSVDPEDQAMVTADQNMLHHALKGRHMQMIAM